MFFLRFIALYARGMSLVKDSWQLKYRRGLVAAFLSFLVFTVMDFTNKATMTVITPLEVVFFNNFFAFVYCLAYAKIFRISFLSRNKLSFHIVRALLTFITAVCALQGFALMSVSAAYSILFLSPLLVVLLAHFILGIKSSKLQFFGVFLGFAGAVFILRPAGENVNLGHLFMLIAALGLAANILLIRRYIKKTDSIRLILFASMMAWMLTLYPVLSQFQGYPNLVWFGLMLSSSSFFVGSLLLNYAAVHAPLGMVGSLQYTQLIWGFLFEYALFNQIPVIWSVLGALLIVVGGGIVSKLPMFSWLEFFRKKQT